MKSKYTRATLDVKANTRLGENFGSSVGIERNSVGTNVEEAGAR